jgi:hypothetical protein
MINFQANTLNVNVINKPYVDDNGVTQYPLSQGTKVIGVDYLSDADAIKYLRDNLIGRATDFDGNVIIRSIHYVTPEEIETYMDQTVRFVSNEKEAWKIGMSLREVAKEEARLLAESEARAKAEAEAATRAQQ